MKIIDSGQKTTLTDVDLKDPFFPIVRFTTQDDATKKRSIFKNFKDEDYEEERCIPFMYEKCYDHLEKNEVTYFVPYFRMWPSQKEDRTFILTAEVKEGSKDGETSGDLYFEFFNEIEGLTLETDLIEGVNFGSTIEIKINVAKDIDRIKRNIAALPLIIYTLNSGVKTEVGKIHLSIAPKDVFSQEEMDPVIIYTSIPPKSLKHDCITAVRKNLEKLLDTKLTKAISYKPTYNMYSLMDYMKDNNYVLGSAFDLTTTPDGRNSAPTSLTVNAENQIDTLINEEPGYHFYTISWISAYHTAILIVNNIDFKDPQIQVADQFGFVKASGGINEFKLDLTNSILLQQIKGWWNWVSKNYSKTNAISKLWKITRILIFTLLFISCSANTNIKEPSTSLLYKTEVCFTKDEEKEAFKNIVKLLEDEGFFAHKIKESANKSQKQQILGDGYESFSDEIEYFRNISFDSDETAKPMCDITQLIFKSDTMVIKFIKTLEVKNKQIQEQEEMVLMSDKIFFTKSQNILYLFKAWVPYYYDSLYQLKTKTDYIIIKPSEKDAQINNASLLNEL